MHCNYAVLIPARMESVRFRGKVVYPILGKPMIWWPWMAAKRAGADELFIVTDSEEVKTAADEFGADVLITAGDFQSGSDRIASVADTIKADSIINIQADEPLIKPELINAIAEKLQKTENPVVSAAVRITEEEASDPDVVKVVFDEKMQALYFSRSPIPYSGSTGMFWQHIGIYGYKKEFLKQYGRFKKGVLESIEKLEQLRILEKGFGIDIIETDLNLIGVDRKIDIAKVEKLMRGGGNV